MKQIKVKRSILSSAHALQAAYTGMKAPKTQNVRNPFPMHTLIRCILPTHDAAKAGKLQSVLSIGKSLVGSNLVSKAVARQFRKALVEARSQAGLTPTEIADTLTAKGFLVNRLTVKTTLHSMGGIGSIPQAAPAGVRGRGESLYFVQA